MFVEKRSLPVKLIIKVIVASLVIITIFIAGHLNNFVEIQRNNYEGRLKALSQAIKRPLTDNLLPVDTEKLDKLLKGLKSTKIVTAVKLTIDNQQIVLEHHFPSQSEPPAWFNSLFDLPLTTTLALYISKDKQNNKPPIAHLELQADSHLLYQATIKAITTALYQLLTFTLILVITLVWLIKRYWVFFLNALDKIIHPAQQKRLDKLKNEIIQGISNKEFQLYLQPQIDIRSDSLISAEALVRWHHTASNEIRMPNSFISVAEKTGLIIPLGQLMLEQVCQYLAEWQSQGIHIPIALNLSVAQLEHPNFSETLMNLVTQYKISPKQLKLEITETGRINHIKNLITLLKQLQQQGFPIVLDDFGVGHSNLDYLRVLTIDTIKVDKSFMQHHQHQPKNQTLVKAIHKIASTLSINVIVEGVETTEQKAWLLEQQLFYAQGYLYAPALTKTVFEERYFSH